MHAAQLVEATEVDQQLRVGEAEPQQRHQALPPGDHLGVVAGIGERPHRLVWRLWLDVVERRRDHRASPPLVAAEPLLPPRAAWMARHTRWAVQGIVMSRTPIGRSASTMLLTTAGVDAIVPASPMPLTPSGFEVAGVCV